MRVRSSSAVARARRRRACSSARPADEAGDGGQHRDQGGQQYLHGCDLSPRGGGPRRVGDRYEERSAEISCDRAAGRRRGSSAGGDVGAAAAFRRSDDRSRARTAGSARGRSTTDGRIESAHAAAQPRPLRRDGAASSARAPRPGRARASPVARSSRSASRAARRSTSSRSARSSSRARKSSSVMTSAARMAVRWGSRRGRRAERSDGRVHVGRDGVRVLRRRVGAQHVPLPGDLDGDAVAGRGRERLTARSPARRGAASARLHALARLRASGSAARRSRRAGGAAPRPASPGRSRCGGEALEGVPQADDLLLGLARAAAPARRRATAASSAARSRRSQLGGSSGRRATLSGDGHRGAPPARASTRSTARSTSASVSVRSGSRKRRRHARLRVPSGIPFPA